MRKITKPISTYEFLLASLGPMNVLIVSPPPLFLLSCIIILLLFLSFSFSLFCWIFLFDLICSFHREKEKKKGKKKGKKKQNQTHTHTKRSKRKIGVIFVLAASSFSSLKSGAEPQACYNNNVI